MPARGRRASEGSRCSSAFCSVARGVAGARMHDQAGGLVDHEDRGVLVHDLRARSALARPGRRLPRADRPGPPRRRRRRPSDAARGRRPARGRPRSSFLAWFARNRGTARPGPGPSAGHGLHRGFVPRGAQASGQHTLYSRALHFPAVPTLTCSPNAPTTCGVRTSRRGRLARAALVALLAVTASLSVCKSFRVTEDAQSISPENTPTPRRRRRCTTAASASP